MFIWLDDSIKGALNNHEMVAQIGLSTILQAVYRREHFVLANRDLLEEISKSPTLAEHERKLAHALASRLTEVGSLENIFSQRVTIVFDQGTNLEKTKDGWRIQLTEVGRRGLRPTTLLGEDITDVQLFIEAANHYLISKNVASLLAPRAELRGAGGKGNVWRSFAVTATQSHEWCICVTDSDRLTHLCGPQPLTKHIDSVVNKNQSSSICGHYVLPTLEIENILPISLINHAVENREVARKSWESLTSIRRTPTHILQHADLKFGTTLWSIAKLAPKSSQRKIWDEEIRRISDPGHIESQCHHGVCKKSLNKHSPCDCKVTPPISETICEDALSVLKKRSTRDSFNRIASDKNIESWLEVGRVVIDWTCGHKLTFI